MSKVADQLFRLKEDELPRFYFISDDDLLLIFGSSDPKSISPHLLKLFDNCKDIIFGKGDKQIVGMISDESEKYDFETPTKPEGAVESWMNKIDEEMKKIAACYLQEGRLLLRQARQNRMD